ncbi:MAG: YbjQ family protein [Actinomycetia bacterium]|nr:YbjQ family protein [Actinomycetes bacterium]
MVRWSLRAGVAVAIDRTLPPSGVPFRSDDCLAADSRRRIVADPLGAEFVTPISTRRSWTCFPGRTSLRSTGFSKGFSGSIKALRKGEVKQFTEALEEARHVAVERMVEHAQGLGVNAIVGLRFDSTDMGEQQGMAEIVAYGTAIIVD